MFLQDHAGEHAAVRIYEGQLAVLKGTASAPVIEVPADFFCELSMNLPAGHEKE